MTWSRARLHAVLLHELAHIRRRDGFAQMLSLCACAIYWPNPLVWMGARRLRREAEMAADDAVLMGGVKASQYAGDLLELAREFRTRRPIISGTALFMTAPSALEARVESVLASTTLRTGVTPMDVLKSAGFGIIAAATLAFACPSLAQEAATPSPPAVPVPATAATPATPPAPPAPATDAAMATPPAPADAVDLSRPIIIDEHGVHHLSRSEERRLHADVERARREAREAVARMRPELARAAAEVKASEAAVRAVRAARPQIEAAMVEAEKERPQVDAAMAEMRPELDRALVQVRDELRRQHFDVQIRERVDAALKRAEIHIEAAKARVDQKGLAEDKVEERDENSDTPDSN
jgi:hypothetical protein